MEADQQFTLAEAAAFKRCSTRTLMRWVQAGRLVPCDDLGTGKHHEYRFKRSELETINRPKPATPTPVVQRKPRTPRGRTPLPYKPQTLTL